MRKINSICEFELCDVDCCLGLGGTKTAVLKQVNLTINRGEIIAVVGPSGAGKSTLLNVMSSLESVSAGEVWYRGENIASFSEKKKANLRLKEFGFVFQSFYLIPSISVHDNIYLPSIMARNRASDSYYKELVELLGVANHEKKIPAQLSGGEMQRVAIARAMINKPNVLFADEPTGNLDSVNGKKVFGLLFRCAREFKQTLIYVTHDSSMASRADRIIYIKDGGVSQ